MISTNSHLPLTPMDPLHDECSGIANADARAAQPRGGGAVAAVALLSAAFSLGLIAGALLVYVAVVLIF